jgi:type I restriction enzyme, R subunit
VGCSGLQGGQLHAGTGVAVRAVVTNAGPADYVLFVNGQAVAVIEAKQQGTTLSGVEWQTVTYQRNLPDALPSNLPDALPTMLVDGRLPHGYESRATRPCSPAG